MGYTQKTENHLFSKSKMDMLALKLTVESEMHPTKDTRFQLPADSKYFRDVPKMISTEDKQNLLVNSKESGLIGNRQFFYASNGFIPLRSVFLRKDVTSSENSAALHFKNSNVPVKLSLSFRSQYRKSKEKNKNRYLVV